MSWNNEQKCLVLRQNGVDLNQSGYYFGHGPETPKKRRDDIKKLCLNCRYKRCIYEDRQFSDN